MNTFTEMGRRIAGLRVLHDAPNVNAAGVDYGAKAETAFLDEALNIFASPHRRQSIAVAIGFWAVRKFGASEASRFADRVVAAVQAASREGV